MEKTKLLPCPFCGAIPELEEIPFWGVGVYCPNCHKQISIVADSTQEAIKAWNTRYKETTVYDHEETIEGCTVQILTNSATGEQSVGWWRGKKEDMPKCGSV